MSFSKLALFGFAIFLFGGSLGTPRVAEANVLSYIKNTFTKSPETTTPSFPSTLSSSQNMGLLMAATNIDPNPAKGGGDIVVLNDSVLVPEVGLLGNIAEIEAQDRQGRISIYVVRAGDTLPGIAKMYGVSVNTILWANDIPQSAIIKPGQTLIILPVNGVHYTIKKDETLGGIAKRYGVSIDDILKHNDIPSVEVLSIGDTIIIPGAQEIVTKPAPARSVASSTTSRLLVNTSSYPSYPGYYTHPLPGGIKTQSLHGYNAIDIGAPRGRAIIASAAGRVIVSRYVPGGNPWNGGYGNYVVIEHGNGSQTLYAHMSTVVVGEGTVVAQGQKIGEVGSTGNSTGPHLHFEIRGARNPF